ncbi:MAG: MrpF/PhaF family protein [Propioniciclava sp.]|uniref:monovalent cation/H+ antiporter complex subunit F n=1 Tax=Propioniciclava sp. TaxID=2038686 RepID=UPI0039E5EC86
MLMLIRDGLIALAVVVLVAAVLLTMIRLAKGPTGLDRGISSDVLISILIAGIATHAIVMRTSVGLIIILMLSLVGFTGAVALARLITGTSIRERRFLEAEARAAYRDQPDAVRRPRETPPGGVASAPKEDA